MATNPLLSFVDILSSKVSSDLPHKVKQIAMWKLISHSFLSDIGIGSGTTLI